MKHEILYLSQSENERNFAANLGLAMEDMAVYPLIYDLAKKKKIGTWLPH